MSTENIEIKSLEQIEELESLMENNPNDQELKCEIIMAYNNYVVNLWEDSPYPYARHKFDKFILTPDLAQESILLLNRAKKLSCDNNELTNLLNNNITYANWAIEKHFDWGFDRTLGLTDMIVKAITPFIILMIIILFILSQNLVGVLVGFLLLALYIWTKYVPGWKIHERQYSWDKMLADTL